MQGQYSSLIDGLWLEYGHCSASYNVLNSCTEVLRPGGLGILHLHKALHAAFLLQTQRFRVSAYGEGLSLADNCQLLVEAVSCLINDSAGLQLKASGKF